MSISHRGSRLRRMPEQGWVAGVLAGLADYFDWNVKLLRVLFVIALLCSGFFPVGLIYCVLWYVLDRDDAPSAARDEPEYTSTRSYSRYSSSGRGPDITDVKARFARLEERLRGMEECVSSKDFELRREFRKLET